MNNHEQALRAIGVSRDAESPGGKSLLIAFNRKPTDDELRRVHDTLAALQPTEQPAQIDVGTIDDSTGYAVAMPPTETLSLPVVQPEAAQDERSRFEREAAAAGYDIRRSKVSRDGVYVDEYYEEEMCSAWWGWQVAKRDAAQAPQERAAVTDGEIYDLVAQHEAPDGLWNGPKFTHDGILQFARALLNLSAQSSNQEQKPAQRTGDCILCGHCAVTGQKIAAQSSEQKG